MSRQQLACVAAVLLTTVSYSDATCRSTDKLKPVDIDLSKYVGERLQVVYVTENDFSVTVDHSVIDITKTGDSQYFAVNTAYMKSGNIQTVNYTIDYKDGVMLETYTDKDEKGKNRQTRSYILGTTDEGALYYYRCSDFENLFDLRFIVVPADKKLGDQSLKKLKSIDESFQFNKNIFKLPN